MNQSVTQSKDTPLPGSVSRNKKADIVVLGVCFVFITIGISLRFIFLNFPVWWNDEALTMLHISGYTGGEATSLISGKIIEFGELLNRFQAPNTTRGIAGILEALKWDQPEHAPLFYIIAYYWAILLGASSETMRLLPFAFGLLQLPAAFWLGWELTRNRTASLIFATVTICSPFHLYYAQEVRTYSFLCFLIILSSACLLRALRNGSIFMWLFYSLITAVGLWTSTLHALVLVAHAIYVVIDSGIEFEKQYVYLSKKAVFFVSSCLLGILVAAPSLMVRIAHYDRAIVVLGWLAQPVPFGELLNAWLYGPLKVFLFQMDDLAINNSLSGVLLFTAGIAVVTVLRLGEKKGICFLFAMLLVTSLFFVIPDVFMGGRRSLHLKYFQMVPIALSLIFAYASWISLFGKRIGLRMVYIVLLSFVFSCQVYSCINVSFVKERARIGSSSTMKTIELLQEKKNALVVTGNVDANTNFSQILAIAHSVPSTIRLLWLGDEIPGELSDLKSEFYVFNPDANITNKIRNAGFQMQPVEGNELLFVAENRKRASKTE